MEGGTALVVNTERFKRGKDTSLPTDPLKASETVCRQFTNALVKLYEFRRNSCLQEELATRFAETPEYMESEDPSPPLFDIQGSLSLPQHHEVIVISSDSSPQDYDPNEIDGYDQDMTGTEEQEEVDEEEAYRILTERFEEKLRRSTTLEEDDDVMEVDSAGNVIKEEHSAAEDEGEEADQESEGGEGSDSETFSILGPETEDQPPRRQVSSENEGENEEEEHRGRNRHCKRLNGHTDRSSASSSEVRRPLKKKPKTASSSDSAPRLRLEQDLSTSEEERREQLAEELMLPPLTREMRREAGAR